MRAVFLVLLLANLAFFAWSRHFSQTELPLTEAGAVREVLPEKLKVVPPPDS